jgi:hypothetical protein
MIQATEDYRFSDSNGLFRPTQPPQSTPLHPNSIEIATLEDDKHEELGPQLNLDQSNVQSIRVSVCLTVSFFIDL